MCFRPPEATKNEMKVCPECKKINDTEGNVCLFCGASLGAEDAPQPKVPPAPPKSPPSPSQGVPVPPKPPKPPGVS